MTDEKMLKELHEDGSALSVKLSKSLDFPAVIEITKRGLFWVTRFAGGQQNAHTMPFARIERVGDIGMAFYNKEDELVIYFTLYEEWPGLDVSEARAEEVAWRAELRKPGRKESFKEFVDIERGDG
jgi:hypothetical protein|tara:strand:- start:4311 stop:4688 length:378 start_codon:yes stop_codon:yes gene_type:complete